MGSAVPGTIAWPLWLLLGAVLEVYNFNQFWSGLWRVITADQYVYGYEVLDFWNWLLYPCRWAFVNTMMYWTGAILSIIPILGMAPTGIMWLNMLVW